MQITCTLPAYASPLSAGSRSVPKAEEGLTLAPVPPGFVARETEDGSLGYAGTSWVKRRLEAHQVKLVAIRHGQSEANAQPGVLLYGQSESPLTAKGVDQARACAQELYAELGGDDWMKGCLDHPDRLPVFISSPLSRAYDSSVLLADKLKERAEALGGPEAATRLAPYLEVKPDPRLLETNFGRFEKRDLSELTQAYPDFVNHWRPPAGMGTDFRHRFPGGESRADLMRRTTSFLEGLSQLYPGRTVVFMSHSECILSMRAVLGLSPVQEGKVRAETSAIANARPYWLVGTAPTGSSGTGALPVQSQSKLYN